MGSGPGKRRARAATRIAVTSAGVLLSSIVLLGGLAVAIAYAAMNHALDRRIEAAAAGLHRAGETGGRAAMVAAIRAHDAGTASGVDLSLVAADGRLLAGSRALGASRPGWRDLSLHDPIEGTDPVRVLTLAAANGDRIAVAGNRRPLMMAQAAIGWLFLASIVMIALLCAVTGWLLARYLDRRLSPIAATAAAVRDGDLAHRVPVGPRGDEFDAAAAALNLMLDQVAALMANLRQVSGDLAHDLRTPLTRLRTRLEGVRDDAEARAAIPWAIAQIDDVVRLFEAILRIAEIDGVRRHHAETVELEALALDVVHAISPAFAEADIDLRLRTDHDAVVAGDRAQIAAALVNLLENVLQHAGAGTSATVTVRDRGDAVVLRVADTGPGVPVAERERIFDRFVRLDRARATPGHGLGLSLVRSIAQGHGATLSAGSAGVGAAPGLAVTIVFPAA